MQSNQTKKKFIFILQGEGRGHMTQAITLQNMLLEYGHEVSCIMVGKSNRREIPDFFKQKVTGELISFESPNFVTDQNSKAIKIWSTIGVNMMKTAHFLNNLKVIDEKVKQYNPDVIINFYDLLAGLYFMLYRPKAKLFCIGHQYLFLHDDFQFPEKNSVDKYLVLGMNFITSVGVAQRLSLSFVPMKDQKKHKIKVLPPLLRKDVFQMHAQDGNFILGYMVNSGYGDEIIEWHKSHRDIEVHCFWDKKDVPEEYSPQRNLTFHKLNDKKFLEMMSQCRGYISTAGFESICEAMWMGKPIMMIPTEGQYEQACNALDAKKAGAGIIHDTFDISKLVDYIPQHKSVKIHFTDWVKQAEEKFIEALC